MSTALRSTAVAPFALSLALLAAAFPAAAVEPLDTFNIRVGGYISKFDTDLSADGETTRGTQIDLHRDLGLDSDNIIGFVGANWRPFDHHEFGFAYYQDSIDATRQLQREISFNGTTYPVNATVRTDYDLDAYELNYIWWAASHETWALGPRLGLIWYKLDLKLDLELDANGNQAGGTASESVSADLPSVTVGGSWRWTPAEDWRISAEAGYFSANFNDIDADVTFGRIGVEWYPWERVGFSLDYTANRIKADVQKSRYNGDFKFTDDGLRLGVAYRF
ncbi:MAG: outer membrane beta-barrel protein [Frateuria sp.]|nr:outer membrane beta-barrel protein [Frateuria sp.]